MKIEYNNGYENEDLIIEILLWLPVKSLMRFKCVCKYWSTLITSSSFISKHFHHPSNIDHLFVHHYDPTMEKYNFALFPNENLANSWLEYQNIGDLRPMALDVFHGLILLCNWNHIVLWNPSIREFRVLHVPEPEPPPFYYYFRHFNGLGLDRITNKYKVVHFWQYGESNNELYTVGTVYNMHTDSWRIFEVDLPRLNDVRESLSNTYINGFCYWMTTYGDPIWILAFDMDKEILGHILGPQIPNYNNGDIVLHNNFLTFFHWDHEDLVQRFFEIWVMKEEGFWIKESTIGPLTGVFRPIGLGKNGEVFIESYPSDEMILYNSNTQEMMVTQINCGRRELVRTYFYKESLVSVKRGEEHQEGNNLFNIARIPDFVPSH